MPAPRPLRRGTTAVVVIAALVAFALSVVACGGSSGEAAAPADLAETTVAAPPPAVSAQAPPVVEPMEEVPAEAAKAASGTISTVVGTGEPGSSGDGGLATDAQIFPVSLAFDPEGNLYISDQPGRVRRVNASGVITTVAGKGSAGHSGDGGPAIEAQIGLSPDLASDAEGNLYLAEYDQRVFRTVSPEGSITTLEPDPCLSAGVAAVDSTGIVYLVCEDHTVVEVDPAGTVTTVAGTRLPGYTGDGGAATEAEINFPNGIAIALDGSLYIGDAGNNRIRRIDPKGVITTIAGTGTAGYSGDGGQATKAEIDLSDGFADLVFDAEGNLYFADNGNERIRRIDRDGVITTVAGTGERGYSGDGGPADEAMLDDPVGLAIDVEGNLYIADAQNYRVRKVTFSS